MADFYQSSSFSDPNCYYDYTEIPQDYSYSYYYPPPPEPESSAFYYSYIPTQSIVAYSPCHDDAFTYTLPCSTQYTVYHSVAASSPPDDVDFVEYDPHPFGGGYDISETYGKPLSPSDDICYPRSSLPQIIPPSPPQQKEQVQVPNDLKSEPQVTQHVEEHHDSENDDDDDDGDGDDDDDDDDDDGTSEGAIQVYEEGVGETREYDGRVVNQNRPGGYGYGHGLEEFDLCENLFGYWPCLERMNKRCDACGNQIVVADDDIDRWAKTADFFFGNPDPYRYGDEVCAAYHQMQPAASMVLYEQVDHYAHNSWSL